VFGFLTRDEIKAILLAVDRSTWIGRRDYALMLMSSPDIKGPEGGSRLLMTYCCFKTFRV
jgi:hypothetical protein